jgi:hypothetical protein
MFNCRFVLLSLAIAGLFLAGTLPSAGDENKEEREAVVLSPKEGAKVSQTEELEGKLNTEGWPVVLVKPLVADEPWWVQSPVDELNKGKFTTELRFGNEQTKPGTKFRVVIVVAKSKEEAFKFERGMTRAALPAGLPRSVPVTVSHE